MFFRMNEENSIIEYEENTLGSIRMVRSIVEKLTEYRSSGIIIYDYSKDEYEKMVRREVTEFILINFWYFLNFIIEKERNKNYAAKSEVSPQLLQEIKSNKNIYEFSRSSYILRMPGEVYDKNQKDPVSDVNISPKLEESFRDVILKLVCPAIAGKVLVHFDNSSVGTVHRYKVIFKC